LQVELKKLGNRGRKGGKPSLQKGKTRAGKGTLREDLQPSASAQIEKKKKKLTGAGKIFRGNIGKYLFWNGTTRECGGFGGWFCGFWDSYRLREWGGIRRTRGPGKRGLSSTRRDLEGEKDVWGVIRKRNLPSHSVGHGQGYRIKNGGVVGSGEKIFSLKRPLL